MEEDVPCMIVMLYCGRCGRTFRQSVGYGAGAGADIKKPVLKQVYSLTSFLRNSSNFCSFETGYNSTKPCSGGKHNVHHAVCEKVLVVIVLKGLVI